MTRTAEKRADWQKSVKLVRFIKELSKHGNVSKALTAAKAARSWVYEKRQKDLDFADTFADAKKCGVEILIDEAHRRAYEGIEEPKTVAGEKVMVQKYSDTLLMFLIKQADPSYREHFRLEHDNAGTRPFMFQMMLHPDAVKAQQEANNADPRAAA